MKCEAGDRDCRHADFRKLKALRHQCFVVAVGDLSSERGEKEIRRYKDRCGKRDQRFAGAAADMKQDQEYQRILEKIIAERRKKLAPEQWRETARQQQRCRFGHELKSVRTAGKCGCQASS